jgi:hypothetical protein
MDINEIVELETNITGADEFEKAFLSLDKNEMELLVELIK